MNLGMKVGGVLLTGAVLFATTSAHAVTPADRCEASKLKLAGKYGFCRLNAESKAAKTGDPADYSKCNAKFSPKWVSAETKGGGMCPTNGDAPAIQNCVTAHTSNIAAALNGGTCGASSVVLQTGQAQCDQGAGTLGPCPGSPAGQDGATLAGTTRSHTDNGDGTITDNATLLMWEKLSDDGTIHDFNAFHTWYDAINVKIAALNSGGGFAGFTDWRLPNVNELQTLANYSATLPATDAIFHTGCTPGCTVTTCSCTTPPGFYWSSTTLQNSPGQAWGVDFTIGVVTSTGKSGTRYVRAVRGGF